MPTAIKPIQRNRYHRAQLVPDRHRLFTVFRTVHRFVETDSAMRTIFRGRSYTSKDRLQQHSAAARTSAQQSHQRSDRDHHDHPKYKDYEENYQRQPCKADAAADHRDSPNKLNPTAQRSSLFDILSNRHGLLHHRLVKTDAAFRTRFQRWTGSDRFKNGEALVVRKVAAHGPRDFEPPQRPQVIKKDRETSPDIVIPNLWILAVESAGIFEPLKFLAFTAPYDALLTDAQEVASPRGFEPRFSP